LGYDWFRHRITNSPTSGAATLAGGRPTGSRKIESNPIYPVIGADCARENQKDYKSTHSHFGICGDNRSDGHQRATPRVARKSSDVPLVLNWLLLVCLFFLTLNFNHRVLYAPSDYREDRSFLTASNIKNSEITEQQGSGISVASGAEVVRDNKFVNRQPRGDERGC
jgi:hypothetical protein